MYEWLGVCLTLALLLTLNTVASLLVGLVWRYVSFRLQSWRGASRARFLFFLRVMPGAVALLGVALLLPAYLVHEPRDRVEPVSLKLAIVALIAFIGLCLAVWRGLSAWLTTWRLVQNWLQHAERIDIPQIHIPTFRLRHPFPVLAVVGVWHPKLFIAENLFDALSSDELDAAIRHELGHLQSNDNFKRTALRICRDVLTLVPSGRAIDSAWNEAAEEAADEFAVCTKPKSALPLAAALVKIARLAPPNMRAAMPVAASFMANAAIAAPSTIAHRVQCLLRLASNAPAAPLWAGKMNTHRRLGWLALAGVCLFLLAKFYSLTALHHVNEWIVHSLR